MMNNTGQPARPLREIEDEVLAEGQEWMRQRLQQKLQQEADRSGRVFPPQPTPSLARSRKNDAPAHRRRRR
jgi:hypothetical protein